MEGLTDILKTITTEMQKSLSPRTAVGDPITIEGKTIVPLMSVGMGFGAGSGDWEKRTDPGGWSEGGGGRGGWNAHSSGDHRPAWSENREDEGEP